MIVLLWILVALVVIAFALSFTTVPKPGMCKLPPHGWYCTLADGHTGPCPTWPDTGMTE